MSDRPTKNEPLEKLLAARSLKEPPRDVLHLAFALKARLPEAKESLAAWIVRVVFDSGLQPVPAGLRSAGGSSERRVLFEAQMGSDAASLRQVDLRVKREAGGTYEVLGQCLPPWQAASVEVRSGRTRRSADLDDAGEFLLRGLAAKDALTLTLKVGGLPVVTLDPVPLPDAGTDSSR